jgi:hypothetical protein
MAHVLAIRSEREPLWQIGLAQQPPASAGRRAADVCAADGKHHLRADEAAKLPAVATKFEMLDKDKDGALTLAEFAAGYTAAG